MPRPKKEPRCKIITSQEKSDLDSKISINKIKIDKAIISAKRTMKSIGIKLHDLKVPFTISIEYDKYGTTEVFEIKN